MTQFFVETKAFSTIERATAHINNLKRSKHLVRIVMTHNDGEDTVVELWYEDDE